MVEQATLSARPAATQIPEPSRFSRARELAARVFVAWSARVAAAVLSLVLLLAVAAPLLPYGPDKLDLDHRYFAPSTVHLLGTDSLGRDVLARLAFGARVSLSVGFAASVVAILLGVVVGGLAGYIGGRGENFIMRGIDALYAFPSFLFAIFISILIKGGEGGSGTSGVIAALGQIDQHLGGLLAVFLAIAATGWLTSARLVGPKF
jgi:ABC-type dipeptide/oligopeptide/nickel transport system permease subunit